MKSRWSALVECSEGRSLAEGSDEDAEWEVKLVEEDRSPVMGIVRKLQPLLLPRGQRLEYSYSDDHTHVFEGEAQHEVVVSISVPYFTGRVGVRVYVSPPSLTSAWKHEDAVIAGFSALHKKGFREARSDPEGLAYKKVASRPFAKTYAEDYALIAKALSKLL